MIAIGYHHVPNMFTSTMRPLAPPPQLIRQVIPLFTSRKCTDYKPELQSS